MEASESAPPCNNRARLRAWDFQSLDTGVKFGFRCALPLHRSHRRDRLQVSVKASSTTAHHANNPKVDWPRLFPELATRAHRRVLAGAATPDNGFGISHAGHLRQHTNTRARTCGFVAPATPQAFVWQPAPVPLGLLRLRQFVPLAAPPGRLPSTGSQAGSAHAPRQWNQARLARAVTPSCVAPCTYHLVQLPPSRAVFNSALCLCTAHRNTCAGTSTTAGATAPIRQCRTCQPRLFPGLGGQSYRHRRGRGCCCDG